MKEMHEREKRHLMKCNVTAEETGPLIQSFTVERGLQKSSAEIGEHAGNI